MWKQDYIGRNHETHVIMGLRIFQNEVEAHQDVAGSQQRDAPPPLLSACFHWLGGQALAHRGSWVLAVSALLILLRALAGTAQPFRCTPTHSHARSSPVSPLPPSIILSLSLTLLLPASCADHSHTRYPALSAVLPVARSPPTLLYVLLDLFNNLCVTQTSFVFLVQSSEVQQ